MKGLSIADLKKHPSLIPLFVFVGAGVLGATYYTLRLAIRNPDVSWNKRSNPEPNEAYANKQYKFYSPNFDYNAYKSPAPNYKEE